MSLLVFYKTPKIRKKLHRAKGKRLRDRDRHSVQHLLQRDGPHLRQQHQHGRRRHPPRRPQSRPDQSHQRQRTKTEGSQRYRKAERRRRARRHHRHHQRQTPQPAVRGTDQNQAGQQRDARHGQQSGRR